MEVELSNNIPSWLESIFDEEFFYPCVIHLGSTQNEKNIFCLGCCKSFCSNCSRSHIGHQILQIRKYNDNRVVKLEDMRKHIDCSMVQSYMLNKAQVVFLKKRYPSRKRENTETEAQSSKKRGKVVNQHNQNWEKICLSCPRSLKDEYNYCSVFCMVNQVLKTEGNIMGYLQQFPLLPFTLEEADGGLAPGNPSLRDPTTSGSSFTRTQRAFVIKHRRKGVPTRSPFY